MIGIWARLDVAARVRRLAEKRVTGQVGWVVATFGVSQLLRLVSSPILASLLTPAILGVFTLVNTLRTGIELISDVGVGQNIVVAKEGDDPAFVSTAWTIQAIRGLALFAVGLIVAWPLALWYGNPALAPMFALTSTVFMLTGFAAPARFVMQRRRETKKLAIYGLALTVTNSAITILFAFIWSSAWSMISANVVYAFVAMGAQFAMMDRGVLRLRLDPTHAKTIFRFGRWIFVSSLIYFAGTNYDRLYLPAAFPLALFGVYGIARQIGDAVMMLMAQLNTYIILPAVAGAAGMMAHHRARIARYRGAGMFAITAMIAAGVAGGDVFVHLAYDARYAAAQVFLPILVAGTWFSAQASVGESVLIGLSAPARAAAGNAAKLGWTALLLPFALHGYGAAGAVVVIALADLPRYLMLAIGQQQAGLGFWRQDVMLVLAGIGMTLLFRVCLVGIGLVDGLISTEQLRQLAILST